MVNAERETLQLLERALVVGGYGPRSGAENTLRT